MLNPKVNILRVQSSDVNPKTADYLVEMLSLTGAEPLVTGWLLFYKETEE